jgi:hypothetical protein
MLQPEIGRPHPGIEEPGPRLSISVVFTSVELTLAALKRAGTLAASLGARINLLVPQIVPFPLPLESPPVLIEWSERRFQVLAGVSQVETAVRIYLCRDRLETLELVLVPRSIVILGARRNWWPSAEKRLARRLRRCGHEVILAETE